ncbi:PPIC-type PPIASE domain containing protein [Tritrichomonas foetus]|uniref:Peptidyl-prolyl cis-trans isomerase n=1 Tax=Tritrichomonas foetus TaxID=1144522 RepID=A0A1J4KG44_9EUKA|nr:PPIC-type PPIASE domain containing protein [Tritrichomonas foetus]|eukprot:OHT10377.1 PPIC-type PPIASE domain containing protein [Tritrichomonas foetus]
MNLPIEWELKEIKEYQGRVFYYNKITHESTWIRPLPYPGLNTPWPPLISVMHILIKHKDSPDDGHSKRRHQDLTNEQAKEKIDDIFKRITEGEKFEEIAKNESDFLTRHKNGDIGWIARGTMDPRFEEVAWNLGIGEISRPVETADGWHIILRNG